MKWLGIIPSIWPPYTNDCLRSMDSHVAESVRVIDNTVRNHGVAGSWNIGARIVLANGYDWLVCMSSAVRFGDPGGTDFVGHLESSDGCWAVEADKGLGWHLIAFHRSTLERVGIFDENCWPAYGEDIDFGWRVHVVAQEEGVSPTWPKVETDARLESVAHGIHIAHAHVEFVGIEEYLGHKWGGHKDVWHEHGYRRPFGDPSIPIWWWPVPADSRCFIPYDRPPDLPWGFPCGAS